MLYFKPEDRAKALTVLNSIKCGPREDRGVSISRQPLSNGLCEWHRLFDTTPAEKKCSRPTLIVIDGSDSYCEDSYFFGGPRHERTVKAIVD